MSIDNNETWWWGYLHKDGKIFSKRYFSQDDIDEASESPFVKDYFGPFKCYGKEDADNILKKAFNQ
jgi:hypothetical protein